MSGSNGVGPSAPASGASADAMESLPLGDRWFPDAFQVMRVPGGFASRIVDMTQAKVALRSLRERGRRATFTHLIVRAAALALARHPELHQMVCTYRRLTPGAVDIGLSMAGQTIYAPVVVLPAVDRQPLGVMVPAMNEAISASREKETRDLANLRRRGWWVPFGFLRRLLLRWFQGAFWFRRRLAGTFQVSCLGDVDVAAPFLFYTGSILSAGSVRDRVVALGGQPVVRPTVWLTVCVDHAAMDGRRAAKLLKAIKGVLESDELVREAREAAPLRGADAGSAVDPKTRSISGVPAPEAA
jgi:hypothetical protein